MWDGRLVNFIWCLVWLEPNSLHVNKCECVCNLCVCVTRYDRTIALRIVKRFYLEFIFYVRFERQSPLNITVHSLQDSYSLFCLGFCSLVLSILSTQRKQLCHDNNNNNILYVYVYVSSIRFICCIEWNAGIVRDRDRQRQQKQLTSTAIVSMGYSGCVRMWGSVSCMELNARHSHLILCYETMQS